MFSVAFVGLTTDASDCIDFANLSSERAYTAGIAISLFKRVELIVADGVLVSDAVDIRIGEFSEKGDEFFR